MYLLALNQKQKRPKNATFLDELGIERVILSKQKEPVSYGSGEIREMQKVL